MNGISLKDVRFDLVKMFELDKGNFYGVKATHIPTGIFAFCGEFKSQVTCRDFALERLLTALQLREQLT